MLNYGNCDILLTFIRRKFSGKPANARDPERGRSSSRNEEGSFIHLPASTKTATEQNLSGRTLL